METDLNELFFRALRKITVVPYTILTEKWRSDVTKGDLPQSQWNANWWYLRRKYQKISPPFYRGSSDFDPGALFDIASDKTITPYGSTHQN